jgi:DNA-binding response OmpR family regulator/chromosome segregation ATPase
MAQRILLFDADAGFAQDVRSKFEAMGATVDVANDGPQGIELATAHRPDLILLTIELPGMNGFLVCKKIKKQDGLSDVPLFILSSEATEDVFEQHKKLRTRAEDYIHKPIAFADLLARVKRFVALDSNGHAAASEDTEESIEISDFEEEEVILVDGEAELEEAEQERAAPTNGAHKSDAAAFARSAVDALMTGDEPELELDDVRAPAPAPAPVMAAPPLAAPQPARGSHVNLPAAAPAARNEELVQGQQEFSRAQAKIAQLENELHASEARARNADQELQSSRQRASSAERSLADASKKGGVSSREFLDLREQLNRKDRELLGLRDQVTARDKQLIELNDRGLALEREMADIADKVVDLQREIDKSKETITALQADKEGARKRLEDMKARSERSEAKARELGDELNGIKATHAKATEARDQRDAEARAAMQAEHAKAFDELRRDHSAVLDALRRAHGDEAADLKEAHEAALNATRAQGEQQLQQMLAGQRIELEAQSEQRIVDLQRKHEEVVSQALAAHEKELNSTREGLMGKHAGELREANDRHQLDLSRLGRSVAELETKRHLLSDQLEESESARTDAQARLAKTTAERDEKADLVSELQMQLDSALARRAADEQLLERARKAFAIGLSLLEEQKGK